MREEILFWLYVLLILALLAVGILFDKSAHADGCVCVGGDCGACVIEATGGYNFVHQPKANRDLTAAQARQAVQKKNEKDKNEAKDYAFLSIQDAAKAGNTKVRFWTPCMDFHFLEKRGFKVSPVMSQPKYYGTFFMECEKMSDLMDKLKCIKKHQDDLPKVPACDVSWE